MQGSSEANWFARILQAGKREKGWSETKVRGIQPLDELIDFFATNPFFQDKETRDVLFDKLCLERANWEQGRLEEIIM